MTSPSGLGRLAGARVSLVGKHPEKLALAGEGVAPVRLDDAARLSRRCDGGVLDLQSIAQRIFAHTRPVSANEIDGRGRKEDEQRCNKGNVDRKGGSFLQSPKNVSCPGMEGNAEQKPNRSSDCKLRESYCSKCREPENEYSDGRDDSSNHCRRPDCVEPRRRELCPFIVDECHLPPLPL